MAGWDEVLGLFVGTVTDLGHRGLSLKSSSDLDVSSGPTGASMLVDVDAGWLVPPIPPSDPAFVGVDQNFHFFRFTCFQSYSSSLSPLIRLQSVR